MSNFPFEIRPNPTPVPSAERERQLSAPGFGSLFTDHMVTARYDPERGWYGAEVGPYGPLSLAPSSSVLHYGQAIFEGLKAFRRSDGHIVAFRPRDHAARFARSAHRMAMPPLPEELFLGAVEQLVRIDQAWVPRELGHSFYVRPTMLATDPYLGVRPSKTYLFLLFGSPAGNYFAGGVAPVNVWLSRDFVRAAPGGTGAAKVAGNYGASLLAQKEAASHQCEQVVWLDAVERKYVEELGGMNLFFALKDGDKTKLVTPALGDTVLAGVTRSCIIQLARDQGIEVEERKFALDEWLDGMQTGRVVEAFACGTAAVITPIGKVRSNDGEWTVHDKVAGPLALGLRQRLLGIQYGSEPDPYGWCHVLV